MELRKRIFVSSTCDLTVCRIHLLRLNCKRDLFIAQIWYSGPMVNVLRIHFYSLSSQRMVKKFEASQNTPLDLQCSKRLNRSYFHIFSFFHIWLQKILLQWNIKPTCNFTPLPITALWYTLLLYKTPFL